MKDKGPAIKLVQTLTDHSYAVVNQDTFKVDTTAMVKYLEFSCLIQYGIDLFKCNFFKLSCFYSILQVA